MASSEFACKVKDEQEDQDQQQPGLPCPGCVLGGAFGAAVCVEHERGKAWFLIVCSVKRKRLTQTQMNAILSSQWTT